MKSQENFYKEVQNKLSGMEKKPPEQVWQNIEARLKKNRSKPWLLFFFSLSALFLLVGTGMLMYMNRGSSLSENTDRIHEISITDYNESYNSEDDYTANQRDSEAKAPELLHSAYANEAAVPSENNTDNTEAVIAGIDESTSKVSQSTSFTTTEQVQQAYQNSKSQTSRTEITESSTIISDSKTVSDQAAKAETRGDALGDIRSDDKSAYSDNLEDFISAEPITSVSAEELNILNSSITEIDQAMDSRISSVLFLDDLYSFVEYENTLPLDADILPIPILIPEDKRNSGIMENLRIFAEARTGLGIGIRQLNLGDKRYFELLENKKDLENPRQNTSVALHVGVLWNKGVSVSSGIEFFNQTEKYRYVDNFAIIDEPLIAYDTVYIGGQEIIRIDTISDYTIGRHTYQHFNTIKSIDIPIIIGYEFPLKNWIISTRGGVYINIKQEQEGQVAGFEKTPVFIDSESVPYAYKTRMGIGYYGELGIAYNLKNNWEIGVYPRIRYNPASILKDGSGLSQKYAQFNINLGLRRYF